MNFSNIFNANKRQFNATLKREGITVYDYYDTNKTYKVFFRRNGKGTTPQGKLRFYYAQDTPINVGTVFVIKGTTYLVISQDSIESDIYFSSLAVKCDTEFSVWINDETKYVNVPCSVVNDRYTISSGRVITMLNGSVTVQTGLNKYSKEMDIGNAYYNFGGYYKVGNYFYNNGLAYIYMTREAQPSTDTYSLTYNGATSLDLSSGTYQLSYIAVKNGSVVDNPSLSYAVSDDTVATVSDTGLLTMVAAGTITVTTTWTDGNNTICTTSITIADASDPNPPVSTGTTVISGNTNLKNGYSRTYGATFYDGSNNTVDGITAVWSITDCTFANEITQTVMDGNKFKVQVNNEDLIGEKFTLNASDTDGNFTSSSITVNIVE